MGLSAGVLPSPCGGRVDGSAEEEGVSPGGRTGRPENGLAARHAALQALDCVLSHRQSLDTSLEQILGRAGLAPRDRAFAYKLTTSVLRRLGQIDDLIDDCLAKPIPARLSPVRDILRLGIVQLLFLATPPHAAVNTTVGLARSLRYAGQAPMVNAVLRRLVREGAERLARQDAARLNTPEWLWHSWVAAHGEALARAIATVHLAEPPLDLTVKPDAHGGRIASELGAVRLPTGSLRLTHAGAVSALAGFDTGEWWVQDAGAALPARLLGDVAGRLVFDLCAAPGGKTAQLAASGARVVAVDRAPARLVRLKENLQRLSLNAEIIEADVAAWQPQALADAVLLDAPCSSTGTIRRHPDVARLKSPSEISALAGVQRRLLAAAARLVRPGGLLVYCVCSLQPEEGASVVDSLLAEGLPMERVPVFSTEFGGWEEFLTTAGDLRTLPCHFGDAGGIDGFFACRLRRI